MRLSLTSFGGPAAHIALMRHEFVERRAWLGEKEFADLVGLSNLIPGPSSTELAMHIGYRRAGGWGLVVAGLSFIVPAMLVVLTLAWGYREVGQIPAVRSALLGMAPVVAAVVAQALIGLGGSVIRSVPLGAAAGIAMVGHLLGLPELPLVLAAGLAFAVGQRGGETRSAWQGAAGLVVLIVAAGLLGLVVPASGEPRLDVLFAVFAKVGSVLYGSGYVLVSYLESDLVQRLGWITSAQLVDAIAIGQFTPGPVFTTATWIGFLLLGFPGAGLATLGIFFPSFALVAVSARWLDRAQESKVVRGFLDGVNAASLGLLGSVVATLSLPLASDPISAGLAVAALAILIRFRVNPAWILIAGALVGAIRP